ncbi:hypothetical protein [Brachybacterium squillarum]|uniref:hypothetical protein n=1 Tax=Brachybacterium squillarum TaxID=661979 RepID=UPI00222156D0|nr:hypothetical protein [Brachybacterium squillarum]MCW1805159.1 hypothetical protein [Brachybacterium squillarum]
MKIEWTGRDGVGRFALSASPEGYDAVPPLDRLIVDRDMLIVNDEILALSGFLAFAPYIGSGVTLPKRVSPEVAAAMQQFASGSYLQITPVDFEPFAAPTGRGMLFVDNGMCNENALRNVWGLARNSTISVLDASKWGGYLISTDHLRVASNARVLADLGEVRDRMLPFLAVALLFVDSMKASTLVVPDDSFESDEEFRRAAQLLDAAKLSLLRESEAIAGLKNQA